SLVPENPAIKDATKPPIAVPEMPLPAEKDLLEGLEDAPVVKVKANANGAPVQVLLVLPPAVEPEVVADVDVDFAGALAKLDARLKDLRKNAANKANLKIAADGELRQQYVMAVYD